ncbi:Titin-like protein [Colletotrichum siamense]|nr:Titin-like protein [Colletotrichum siamense]
MYSPPYSIGGHRSISHENRSVSRENRSVARQITRQLSQDRTPRNMSHGTFHRSSSQSYGNSKDASRSDPRRRSHSISHQVSRTISHDPTCDICNDATSCDKCRQGSVGTSHSSSSDISRTFSHTMPQSTSYTTYSGGDSRIGSGDFSKSFSQSLLYGGSSHKDHEGSSNDASNAMAESYSRDFPQSTSYATRGGDSHHDSTDFSQGRRQSFLQSFHRSSYDGHGDVPKALNFAPKSSSHMVSESFSPDLPQSPSWEIRTDFNPHGSGNNDTSHEACCDICSGGSSSSSNEASNHVTHVARDGGGGGGGGFYEDWSNHSHRPQSPTHDRAHNISGIIVGDRSNKVTGDAHKHKTRDVDGPTSNTSGKVSTTTHITSNNGTPNVSGNTSPQGHPKRHDGPHGASRDVTNNNSREQTDGSHVVHHNHEHRPSPKGFLQGITEDSESTRSHSNESHSHHHHHSKHSHRDGGHNTVSGNPGSERNNTTISHHNVPGSNTHEHGHGHNHGSHTITNTSRQNDTTNSRNDVPSNNSSSQPGHTHGGHTIINNSSTTNDTTRSYNDVPGNNSRPDGHNHNYTNTDTSSWNKDTTKTHHNVPGNDPSPDHSHGGYTVITNSSGGGKDRPRSYQIAPGTTSILEHGHNGKTTTTTSSGNPKITGSHKDMTGDTPHPGKHHHTPSTGLNGHPPVLHTTEPTIPQKPSSQGPPQLALPREVPQPATSRPSTSKGVPSLPPISQLTASREVPPQPSTSYPSTSQRVPSQPLDSQPPTSQVPSSQAPPQAVAMQRSTGPPPQGPPQEPPTQPPAPREQPQGSPPPGTSSHYVPEKDPFNGPTYSETSHDHGESDEHRRVGKPITRHGWRRFLYGWMIHIPAIILTAIILWLASRERYWYGLTGPSRVRLSPKGVEVFLLFAFKIYEIFVILSLSAMAISMFRRRLIGGGVRLGFLTGAYRVGDFRYIFSLPFWRHGFLSLSFWEMMLALFVLFATIFSLLLLPAAGALLLPSLQWYGMNHNKAFGGVSAPLLYQTQPDQVWPTLFTDGAPWNNTPVCVEAEGIYNAACPAGGFTTVWNWAKGYSTTGLQDTVTFSSPSTNLSRQLMVTEVTADSDTRDPPVLSTTPSHHFNINFGLVKNYIENGNTITEDDSQYRLSTRRVNAQNPDSSSPIYQPFIQSLCNVVPKSDVIANNGSLVYPISSLNCFGDATCLQMKRASPARSLDVSAWDSEECHLQLITTDFFVFQNGTPIIEVAGQLPDVNGDYRKDRLFSCTMLATWVAAEVSTDSSECGALVSDLNDPETMIETYQKASFSGNSEGYVMKFDPSWFQYLSPVSFASSVAFNGSDALRYYNPPESLVRNFVDAEVAQNITNPRITNSTIDSARAEVFLAKVFGVYLTDAIARTGSSSTALIRSESGQSANQLPVANSNVQSNVHFSIKGGTPANETTGPTVVKHISGRAAQDDLLSESMGFDFGVERYGWGTGKPSRALAFGKAILYMYLAVLILYLLTVIGGLILELCGLYPNMRVLSIVPWWDLQGLLVLAMRTPPPGDGDFADAGAGITSSHLWKKRVRAMADLEHNVQLVYNDDTVRDELDKTGKVKYF